MGNLGRSFRGIYLIWGEFGYFSYILDVYEQRHTFVDGTTTTSTQFGLKISTETDIANQHITNSANREVNWRQKEALGINSNI